MSDPRELYIHFSLLNGLRVEMITRSGRERHYQRPTQSTINRIQDLTWSNDYITGLTFNNAMASGLATKRVGSLTIQPREV